MPYIVELKPRALKDLAELPKPQSHRILAAIEALQSGFKGDVKKLTNFTPEYRLRVGKFRVLFEVEDKSVVVYRVLHRRDAYR